MPLSARASFSWIALGLGTALLVGFQVGRTTRPRTTPATPSTQGSASALTIDEVLAKIDSLASTRVWFPNREWADFITALAPGQFPAAVAAAEKLPVWQVQIALQNSLANRWGMLDPLPAIAWAQNLPNRSRRPTTLMYVVAGWAAADAASAATWVEALEGTARRLTLLQPVVMQLAMVDPVAAFDVARRESGNDVHGNLLAQVLGPWAAQDPEGAIAAITSMAPGTAQQNAWRNIAHGWAAVDRTAALAWTQERAPKELRPTLHRHLEHLGKRRSHGGDQFCPETRPSSPGTRFILPYRCVAVGAVRSRGRSRLRPRTPAGSDA